MANVVPEREIKAYLQKLLNDKGIYWWRNQSFNGKLANGMHMVAGKPGLPDLFAMTAPFRLDAVELKSESGKLSDDQVAWSKMWEETSYGKFIVIKSKLDGFLWIHSDIATYTSTRDNREDAIQLIEDCRGDGFSGYPTLSQTARAIERHRTTSCKKTESAWAKHILTTRFSQTVWGKAAAQQP